MKLHLPKFLRNAVLACAASVVAVSTTVGTATVAGGAFVAVLSSPARAEAETVNSNTTWGSDVSKTYAAGEYITVEGDITLTISGATVSGEGVFELKNSSEVVVEAGSTVNVGRLAIHNSGTNSDEAFIIKGGTVNFTDADTGSGNFSTAVLIGHWGGSSSSNLTVEGGQLNVLNGTVKLAFSSAGIMNINGGEANIKKIDTSTGYLNVTGGRLNIGEGGITGNSKPVILTGGATLGALAEGGFTLNPATKLGNVTIDTNLYTPGATPGAGASGVGVNITLAGVNDLADAAAPGVVTLAGSGSLTISNQIKNAVKLAEGSTATVKLAADSLENFFVGSSAFTGYSNTTDGFLTDKVYQIVGAGSGISQVTYGESTLLLNENGAHVAALGGAANDIFYVNTSVDLTDAYASQANVKVKEGAELVVSGDTAHTISGTLTNAGNVEVNASTTIGTLVQNAGKVTLNGTSTITTVTQNGGSIVIGNGKTVTINTMATGSGTEFVVDDGATVSVATMGDQVMKGNLTIKNGGTFTYTASGAADFLHYGGSASITVTDGTLNLGTNRASLKTANRIYLTNATVTGAGQGDYGALDIVTSYVLNSSGNSEISAAIRQRAALEFAVADGTLVLSGVHNAQTHAVKKSGAGALKLAAERTISNGFTMTGGSLEMASALTLSGSNSTFTKASISEGGSLTLAEGATLNLGSTLAGATGTTVTLNGAVVVDLGAMTSVSAGASTENGLSAGKSYIVSGSTVTLGANATVSNGETQIAASELKTDGGGLYLNSGNVYWVNTGEVTYDAGNADMTADTTLGINVQAAGTLVIAGDSGITKSVSNNGTVNISGALTPLEVISNSGEGVVNLVDSTGDALLSFSGAFAGKTFSVTADETDEHILTSGGGSFNGVLTIHDGVTLKGHRLGSASSIVVSGGATYDFAGVDNLYKFILEDGSTVTNSGNAMSLGKAQFNNVTINGNVTMNAGVAEDGTDQVLMMVGGGWGKINIDLEGSTITKTGAGTYDIVNGNLTGSGVLDIKEGTLSLSTRPANSGNMGTAAGISVQVDSGATFASTATNSIAGINGEGTLALGVDTVLTIGSAAESASSIASVVISSVRDNDNNFAELAEGAAATLKLGAGTTLTGLTNLSGGSLILAGAGSVELGGMDSSLSGVSVADDWAGSVDLTGASITSAVDTSLLSTGASTLVIGEASITEDGELSLGGAVTLNSAITSAGSVKLDSSLLLDISNIQSVDQDTREAYVLVSGGTVEGSLDISAVTGLLSGMDWKVDTTDGLAIYREFKNITWDDSKSVWGNGVQIGAAEADKFNSKDNVTFGNTPAGGDVTVGLDGDLVAGKVTVAAGADKSYTIDATNGTLTADSVEIVSGSLKTNGTIKADSVLMSGGSLEMTDSSATIDSEDITITGGSLVANSADWGLEGAAISGVTIEGANTVTLTDTTLKGTITNKGNLKLDGTTTISSDFDANAKQETITYSAVDGTLGADDNGFRFVSAAYDILNGSNESLAAGSSTTWVVNGATVTGTLDAEGKLNLEYAQDTDKLYWVNSGSVDSAAGGIADAKGFAINGGTLVLDADMAAKESGIVAKSSGTVVIGSDVTLAASSIKDTTKEVVVTVSGDSTATLDNGSSTSLAAGVELADDWAGTVSVSGLTVENAVNLSSLGSADSIVELGDTVIADGGSISAVDNDNKLLLNGGITIGALTVAPQVTAATVQFGSNFDIAIADGVLSSTMTGTWGLLSSGTAVDNQVAIDTIIGTGKDGLYKYEYVWDEAGKNLSLVGSLNGTTDITEADEDTTLVLDGDTTTGIEVGETGSTVGALVVTDHYTGETGTEAPREYTLSGGELTVAGDLTVGTTDGTAVSLTVSNATTVQGNATVNSNGALTMEGGSTLAVEGTLTTDQVTISSLTEGQATMISANEIKASTAGEDVIIHLVDDVVSRLTDSDLTEATYKLLSAVQGIVLDDANMVESGLSLSQENLEAFAKASKAVTLGVVPEATTFALRGAGSPVISLIVRGLTLAEQTWDTSGAGTDKLALGTLTDGVMKLERNNILDSVRKVVVTQNTTLDLSSTDTDAVNIKGLSGDKNLTVSGNGDTVNITTAVKQDDGTIAAGKHDGALVLSGVHAKVSGQYGNIPAALGSGTLVKNGVQVGKAATAELDVKDSKVVLDGGSLSGDSAMDGGVLVVMSSNAAIAAGKIKVATGNSLTVSGTDIAIVGNATDSMVLDVKSTGKHVIADLGKVKGNEGEVAIVDEANKSIAVMDKYFTNTRLENGKVVADRNSSYYSDKAGESVSANGAEGLAMADAALVYLNPQATAPKSALATVLTTLDTATGDAADELGASLAGASTAVLGMATMGDVDRQLQAIRNRTTTMGVDQSVANEDMPYFNAWINAEGDRSELSESGTESGYELSSWGGTVGFDVDLCPTLTAGMALTAMYGDLDTTGADVASGNIDTYYVTAFARYAPSAWTHTFVATVGMSDISLDRKVAGVETKGETDGLSFGLMYEVGRVFALDEDGSTCLQPVFNVTWKHTTVDAYTEDGSDLALEVDEQTLDTVTFGLGARLQSVVGESMYNRTSILEARVLAKADVGDRNGSSDVALAALPGATGSVDSAEMGTFGLEAGAGLTIPVGQEGGSVFMDASVELRSDYTNVNGTVGYRINF